ncbi:MAG: hypothetical protein IJ087_04450 [Eggerthellaceae bacterium]|nr:hypothetical protein [Eggerthellaceae bacterium]
MITRKEFIECHWNSYLLRERKFLELCSCVALRPKNMVTCSDEIIDQLMLVCSHFESLVRDIYGLTGNGANIGDFLASMQNDQAFDMNRKVWLLEGDGVPDRFPLKGCGPQAKPLWWDAHNHVKHQRASCYEEGAFENLLDALAALYLCNMVYVKKVGDYWLQQLGDNTLDEVRDVPNDISQLFELEGWSTRHHVAGRNRYFATDEEVRAALSGA